jgi:inward rectifier potassium channel
MAHRERRQIVELGGVSAVKTGIPARAADLYYALMEMGWGRFIALVVATFLAINFVFGTIYWALPGSIANAVPGSLIDGIFFSIDTLGTVGYGYMYPATHFAHLIAATEILIGLFFSATMTGLIFARFARPRTSIVFSRTAVVGRYEGKRAIMVRAASMRSKPLADAVAQMSWLETIEMPGGGKLRRITELDLVRSRNPVFGLTWMLIHVIDEDSPMLEALNGSDRFWLNVTITGTDSLLAAQAIGDHRYTRADIRIDHEFVDVLTDHGDTIILDLALLHDTRPID